MLQTTVAKRDIDQAARYIGAGAATVGVAGSGMKILIGVFSKVVAAVTSSNISCKTLLH